MAGAIGGTWMEVETLQRAIERCDRPDAQRDTLYRSIAKHQETVQG
ncbi:MAG TPA: hypothetical protein VL134_10005 [Leptolyngbya sp.]|nr:hypothetical protein [Leptolyngbya sp.]